jgi:DNA repair protein RadC
MNISSVSDSEILTEYVRRFTIQAGESIKTAKEAADFFRSFFANSANREQFLCAFLNSQHQLMSTEVLFVGTIDS